jgi:glucokinase
MNAILSIDSGGTYYKSALIDPFGNIIPDTFAETPSHSDAGRDIVLSVFTGMLKTMKRITEEKGLCLTRIAFDFPGPFDYKRGACIMQHKFLSINNLSLVPFVRRVFGDTSIDVVFHHDLHACTYGAYLYDVAKGFSRVFCVAIGTGLGTGYLQNGEIVMKDHGGPMYPIFQEPYGKGVLEDVVSNRGIVTEYRCLTGSKEPIDARIVQQLSESGDLAASAVYDHMGCVLGEHIRPLLQELQAGCLILGGQISKGFHLFGPALQAELEGLPLLQMIAPIENLTTVTIRGAAALPLPK